MKLFRGALILGLVATALHGWGETLEENRAEMKAANKALSDGTLKDTPWHLVDLWWNLGTNAPFQSYSIDINVMDDVPTNVNLYISPVGLGKLNGMGFYGGLQTHSDRRSQLNLDGEN